MVWCGSSNKYPQRPKAYHVLAIQSDSKGFKTKLLDLKAIYELQLLLFNAQEFSILAYGLFT